MVNSSISVTTTVTLEDVKILVKKKRLEQLKNAKYIFFLFFAFILFNSYKAYKNDSVILGCIVFIVQCTILFLANVFAIHSEVKTTYKNGKSDFDYTVYNFSKDNLELKSVVGEVKLNWASISKMEEDENFILIIFKHQKTYLLPKRCFKDKKNMQDVIQLIRNMIIQHNTDLTNHLIKED